MPRAINPRILVAAGVALVAAVVIAVLAVSGSGDGNGEKSLRTTHAKLKLERSMQPDTGVLELVVSLPEQQLNTLATSGGATSVQLRCTDRQGTETIQQRHTWPLVEEAGFFPHIHQPAVPRVLNAIRECRMTGKGIDFSATVRGRIPQLGQPTTSPTG